MTPLTYVEVVALVCITMLALACIGVGAVHWIPGALIVVALVVTATWGTY